MNNFLYKKSGFTLIELVVVIMIIGILSAIGVQSYVGYLESARDTQRVEDLTMISKSLDEYIKVKGVYPTPDRYSQITWSGSIAWYQGTVSDGLTLALRLPYKPIDPIYAKTEYTYSLTANNKQYQLGSVYESQNIGYNNYGLSNTYAAGSFSAISMVRGNYNMLAVGVTNSGSTIISYISSPSIILSDTGVTELNSESFNTGSFVIHKKNNIPLSYGINHTLVMSGDFYFKPKLLFTFENGTVSDTNITDSGVISFMENLKTSFNGATFLDNTANIGIWNTIINLGSGTTEQITIGRSIIDGLAGFKLLYPTWPWGLKYSGPCGFVDNDIGNIGDTSSCTDTRDYVMQGTGATHSKRYNLVKVPSDKDTKGNWWFNQNIAYPLDVSKYIGDTGWTDVDNGYFSCPGSNLVFLSSAVDCSKVATYGYVYQWSAAISGALSNSGVISRTQGICPDGWAIPTYSDMTSDIVVPKYWPNSSDIGYAGSTLNFSVRSGLFYRDTNYGFSTIGNVIFSSEIDDDGNHDCYIGGFPYNTSDSPNNNCIKSLLLTNGTSQHLYLYKGNGTYIRCIKN